MSRATITVDVNDDDAPTIVYWRGGAHLFDVERDALEFVVRRQTADPALAVEVRVR